ncbi:hypothetical protein HNY73_013562 [Argiope bruennichi]|uniref:Uncharacterized protein n=1 Tax=Argiope bruennichi TaxID=94029 RepID=A0A8T0F3B3_ARGBR|nr:hypothetical protein HNY73_013562 [Argiope bruennichi]
MFGVSSSPFLLGSKIQYHLERKLEGRGRYPECIIQKLMNSFYVDNCLASVKTQSELERFIDVATEIMAERKFDLRGWEHSSPSDPITSPTIILGTIWDRHCDTLSINIPDLRELMEEAENQLSCADKINKLKLIEEKALLMMACEEKFKQLLYSEKTSDTEIEREVDESETYIDRWRSLKQKLESFVVEQLSSKNERFNIDMAYVNVPIKDGVEKFQNVLQNKGLGFRVSNVSDNKSRPIFGNPGVATSFVCRNSIIRGESRKMYGKQVSFRYGSWFNSNRLTMEEIFLLTFEILIGTRTGELKEKYFFGNSTLSNWRQFINERILEYVQENSEKNGGAGRIVEVDESKFGKRKYSRGHRVKGQWGFGGVERESGRTFLVTVQDRKAETMD